MRQQREDSPNPFADPIRAEPDAEPHKGPSVPNAEQRAFAAWDGSDGAAAGGGPLDALAIDAGILATAAGDRRRFAELFEMMAPRAKAYLVHRGVTASLAEDLAIEAMINVWRTAGDFNAGAGSGQAWIFRLLREASCRRGVTLSAVIRRDAA